MVKPEQTTVPVFYNFYRRRGRPFIKLRKHFSLRENFSSSTILEALVAFSYLVLCGSFLAYTAFGYLLEREPAAKVATHAYVNPVVGVILGALLLGERITGWMLLALPLVLAGVFLVQRAEAGK
ncbi:MAG: EamA family transporter [Firmicutes bacterium]|nr:EamA family transporter [Bacillota bacterium]